VNFEKPGPGSISWKKQREREDGAEHLRLGHAIRGALLKLKRKGERNQEKDAFSDPANENRRKQHVLGKQEKKKTSKPGVGTSEGR